MYVKLLYIIYFFIKLCVQLVVSTVETVLHLEYVHVPLCGLAMIVPKVCTYVWTYIRMYVYNMRNYRKHC